MYRGKARNVVGNDAKFIPLFFCTRHHTWTAMGRAIRVTSALCPSCAVAPGARSIPRKTRQATGGYHTYVYSKRFIRHAYPASMGAVSTARAKLSQCQYRLALYGFTYCCTPTNKRRFIYSKTTTRAPPLPLCRSPHLAGFVAAPREAHARGSQARRVVQPTRHLSQTPQARRDREKPRRCDRQGSGMAKTRMQTFVR